MKSGTTNKMYCAWEKDQAVADILPDFKLNKEELCCWLHWLRKEAKRAKIWSGMNDEIAYMQVRRLIEKMEIR